MRDVFSGLADPTRRDILRMLVDKPMHVNDLASRFNMTRPAVSKHLRILVECGLVEIRSDRKDGRLRYCYAHTAPLQHVQGYLDDLLADQDSNNASGSINLADYLKKAEGH